MANFDFDNLNDFEKLFVVKSMIKGAIHATVAPLLIMLFINITFSGNWGSAFALSYILILGYIYHRSSDKYFSRKGFFMGIKALILLAVFLLFLGMMSAFIK